MGMMYIVLLLSLLLIRICAGYDSRYQKGKNFSINHRILRILLIDKMSFFERTNRPKKDRNKISLPGVILYIFSFVVIAANIVLLCFVPEIPMDPWEIETDKFYMYVDTFNQQLSAALILVLFISALLYMVFELTIGVKQNGVKQKWIKILIYLVFAMTFTASILITVCLVKALILSFFD